MDKLLLILLIAALAAVAIGVYTGRLNAMLVALNGG